MSNPKQPGHSRPNLLVICTDQQHHGMMSCAGNVWLHTPAMDRMAGRGVRFARAYCSNPVCVPSRFSLWTGRMPSAVGIRDNSAGIAPPPQVAASGLGHLLRAAGYEAAFVGKQHLPCGLTAAALGFDYLHDDERDRCAVEAAAFIRRDHRAPWLLAVNLINPHDICYMGIRAFEPENPLVRRGALECAELDEALRLPPGIDEETFFREHCPPLPANHPPQPDEPEAIRRLFHRPFRRLERERWDARAWRLHRWAYHRLTERVDRQVAVVLDALETAGRLHDTVVVFTSDHGDHDASHRLEHKDCFYDEAERIPLIIADPASRTAGTVNDTHLVSNGLDLLPTLCDYAEVAAPAHCLGRSLRPLAAGQPVPVWREGVYAESEVGFMVVTRDRKYVEHDRTGEEQLYDLVADPGETRSIHRDPAHAEQLGGLRAALRAEKAAHAALAIETPPPLQERP